MIPKFRRLLDAETDSTWIAEHIRISNSISDLIADFKAGTTVSVSDGSYFKDIATGAAAWIIQSENGKEYITGDGVLPGRDSCQSSYQAELGGIFGLSLVHYVL